MRTSYPGLVTSLVAAILAVACVSKDPDPSGVASSGGGGASAAGSAASAGAAASGGGGDGSAGPGGAGSSDAGHGGAVAGIGGVGSSTAGKGGSGPADSGGGFSGAPAGASGSGGTGGSALVPQPCVPGAGFTACVEQCGEAADVEAIAATCTNGYYECPAPLFVAAACPSGSWPAGAFAGCGPWVTGYDCGNCTAACAARIWTCPACPDAGTDGG
jgi:hypothetical protein